MSMTTHVVGFRPADETLNKMKGIWENCEQAGVTVPTEVVNFFNGEPPGDRPGMEIEIEKAAKPYNSEGRDGFEVEIAKLPPNVTVIRFYNSY